ncbi:DUF1642 domain-containing protein [Streptococcus sp. AM43-2AT]|nr:DUF1642 domain-containing protein [Streptococcus sp. AM43-2AT]
MIEQLLGRDGSMNKQELIEHISNTLDECLRNTIYTLPIFSITESAKSNEVSLELKTERGSIVLDRVPQKLVVPQFVADWYEKNKDDFENALFQSIDLMPSIYEEKELSEFEEWLVDEHTKPFQILVNMHQFGYEVEKEKRYLVKMKGITSSARYLKHNIKTDNWFFSGREEAFSYRAKHTRKELEDAGFGWVFNCEGIEIAEVEE